LNKSPRQKKLIIYVLLAVVAIYSIQILNIISYPSQIDVIKGQSKKLDFLFPFTVDINGNENRIVEFSNNYAEKLNLGLKNTYEFKTINNGIAQIGIKIFGLVPVKNVKVNVIDQIYLVPGGDAIGVKLNTKGVLVVGTSEITDEGGNKHNPAKEAGIRIGDSIIEIDGIKVKDANHVISLLNKVKNKKIEIKIERNNATFSTNVKPVKSNQDGCYRLGIWVRDKTAGIGTLTFYDPNSKKFGALGHAITDIDTGSLMKIENGEIMKAKVSSIQQGKKGSPGEIRGIFFESEDLLGKIESNTTFGIYGTMYNGNQNISQKKELPVGLQSEIKLGKAYILTTTHDNKVEKYEIEIVKLERQNMPESKSMVIKVTDKRLIDKTGGIVQGMSGSPIMQNGKIIGAITHVFVNDPTKGYGLYIEWMLKEAGILVNSNNEFAKYE
jgi:stage IV sporulation protein B